MFDLNRALAEWKRSLRRLESFEEGAIAELESHLLDEFDRQKAADLYLFSGMLVLVLALLTSSFQAV